MSLTEFMADPSLGTPSWIEDDFDITSTLNANPFKPVSSSPFGGSGNKSNFFERSHNYNMREDRNDAFHELEGAGSWRSSAVPRGAHSLNYRDSNIVVFDNVPFFCTRQLIKELFESRYTKLEKCHVLLDPSDPTHKKKIAFVFLYTPQDKQKVLKWNGINIERSRIIIDSASSNEFQSVLQFNQDLNFDEDKEDERIEQEQREQRELRFKKPINPASPITPITQPNKPKVNPFGNAKPVAVPEIPIISENTKEIAKVLDLDSKSDNHPKETHPKVNPFGNAKPVLVPEIPIISENTAEIARKLEARSDSSKKSSRANSVSKSPVRPSQPKQNPFGNAKPVDTLAKQLEIEKKLSKAAINETTFDMTLIHGKKAEDEPGKKGEDKVNHDPGSPVKILRRKNSSGNTVEDKKGEESKSPSSSSSSSGKGYKTTSGFERRIARDLSEEEYEQEMKKRNELRSHSNGKERGRGSGSGRRLSGARFGNKQRHNQGFVTNNHGVHGHTASDKHEEYHGSQQEPTAKRESDKSGTTTEHQGVSDDGKSEGKVPEQMKVGKKVKEASDSVVDSKADETVEVEQKPAVDLGSNSSSSFPSEEPVLPEKNQQEEQKGEANAGPENVKEEVLSDGSSGNDKSRNAVETNEEGSPTSLSPPSSRGHGRGRGGRGNRRGRGSRGSRGEYSEHGWGREGYGYTRSRGSRGSSNRSRGGYNSRGGYRNLVYHKPSGEAKDSATGTSPGTSADVKDVKEPKEPKEPKVQETGKFEMTE